MAPRLFQIHEFARRTGVTVRTLHHYDRIGLLPPGATTDAGHRLYGETELMRLQQIVTLKFLGFPLRRIKELLENGLFGAGPVFRVQRRMLADRRAQLDQAIEAIDEAQRRLDAGGALDWESLRFLIEVVEMKKNGDWVAKYYTPEQLQELGTRWSPEVQEKAQRDWAELIRDVEAALGEDPAGPKARALAERWEALIGAFTGGNPAIRRNLEKLYADRRNWPATFKKPYSDEVGAFIEKARAARKP